jgi:hypothetical protein
LLLIFVEYQYLDELTSLSKYGYYEKADDINRFLFQEDSDIFVIFIACHEMMKNE